MIGLAVVALFWGLATKTLWISIVGLVLLVLRGIIYLAEDRRISASLCVIALVIFAVSLPSGNGNDQTEQEKSISETNYDKIRNDPCARFTDSSDYNNCVNPSYEDYGDDHGYGDDSPGTHWVEGYTQSDGTYVNGYERSNPDGNLFNNLKP